jgi:hypothetical protein
MRTDITGTIRISPVLQILALSIPNTTSVSIVVQSHDTQGWGYFRMLLVGIVLVLQLLGIVVAICLLKRIAPYFSAGESTGLVRYASTISIFLNIIVLLNYAATLYFVRNSNLEPVWLLYIVALQIITATWVVFLALLKSRVEAKK